jgi:RNA polymerase sigma-70 factor (ECF subfamily)
MTTTSDEALSKLLHHRSRFLSFIERRVRSPAVAEAILQAALMRALERYEQIRFVDASVAWFYRLLRNAIADHYRNEATTTRMLEEWAKEAPTSQPPIEAQQDGECRCIPKLLSRLKAEYQDAIRSVDMQELSLIEFANLTGISSNNAAVRVHRARKALLKLVVDTCGTCSDHHCESCDCR